MASSIPNTTVEIDYNTKGRRFQVNAFEKGGAELEGLGFQFHLLRLNFLNKNSRGGLEPARACPVCTRGGTLAADCRIKALTHN
jgi:hypothetical protein